MHRTLLGLLLALALPASAQAVTLVTPTGQPIGGKWQRWTDESKVPTIPGKLMIEIPGTLCGGAFGCSEGPPKYGDVRETGVTPNPDCQSCDRDTLYFELGHQFDWYYLTDQDRRYLKRHWGGAMHYSWWDSQAGMAQGSETGLEAVFASLYLDCAEGINDQNAALAVFGAFGSQYTGPSVLVYMNPCRFIRHIANRQWFNYAGDIRSTKRNIGSRSDQVPIPPHRRGSGRLHR